MQVSVEMLSCCVLIDSDVPCPMIMDFKTYNCFTETDNFRQVGTDNHQDFHFLKSLLADVPPFLTVKHSDSVQLNASTFLNLLCADAPQRKNAVMELEVQSWSLGLFRHNYKVHESGKGTAGLAAETVQMMYVRQCIKLF